jgi:hypothetical protein
MDAILLEYLRWAYAAPAFTAAVSFLFLLACSMTLADLVVFLARKVVR